MLPTLDRRVEPVVVGTCADGVEIGENSMIMLAAGLFDSQDEGVG